MAAEGKANTMHRNKFHSSQHFLIVIENTNDLLGTIHKRRPQSRGEGGFVQCGSFADKGEVVLQMLTSELFGAKTFEFF